jgi:predicted site-specific integrase-resolvase
MDKLVSLPRVADDYLGGISIWTVRKWVSQGLLRRTKIGRRTMILESEIQRFIDEQNADSKEIG